MRSFLMPRRRSGEKRAHRSRIGAVEALEGRLVLSTIVVDSLADSGAGSLRAAVGQANADPAADTISFAPGLSGSIQLQTPLPSLSTAISLDGPGASALAVERSPVPATPVFRVFLVAKGANVSVSGLSISGGRAEPASVGSGASQGFGGGIENQGTLALSNVVVQGNSASGFGGGIDNAQGASLSVVNSTVAGNSSQGNGGGISNEGTLTLSASTVAGNSAVSGGGLANSSSGTATVVNSTISGNSASGTSAGQGGGAFENSGNLLVVDSTVAENMAAFGGGILNDGGTLRMQASIFANSTGNLVNSGTAVSLGHNLFSDVPGVASTATDLLNTDPRLLPLADNGGPTMTQALQPDSPAVNAGVAVPGVTTDQRGVSRPLGAAPDIGAFELLGSSPKVESLQRTGYHAHPTRLVLTFSGPLARDSAENWTNYSLVSAGADHRIGTRDDRSVPIVQAVYDPSLHSVTLAPLRLLPLRQTFQLTVNGQPPNGLTSISGVPLDGSGTGHPGTNYTRVFGREILVNPPTRVHPLRLHRARR